MIICIIIWIMMSFTHICQQYGSTTAYHCSDDVFRGLWDMINMNFTFFPKMVVPPHHPFLGGIFPYKPTIFGYPDFRKATYVCPYYYAAIPQHFWVLPPMSVGKSCKHPHLRMIKILVPCTQCIPPNLLRKGLEWSQKWKKLRPTNGSVWKRRYLKSSGSSNSSCSS